MNWRRTSAIPLAAGSVAGVTVWYWNRRNRREQHLETLVAERTQALEDARSQVRSLFFNSPLAISLAAPTGQILAANPALAAMTGYSQAELEQINTCDLCDASHLQEVVRQTVGKGEFLRGLDVQLTHKDGHRVDARLNVSRLGGSGQDMLLWVFEDVTDQVQAREALRQTHRLLERRHRIAEGMRAVMAALNSNLPLDDVLQMIVADSEELLAAHTVAIVNLDRASAEVHVRAVAGTAVGLEGSEARKLTQSMEQVITSSQPMMIADPGRSRSQDGRVSGHSEAEGGLLIVPIVVEAVGFHGCMLLRYSDGLAVTQAEIELATLFAAKAVLAIENSELKAAAQEMATANERNRVARELHDSVTQSLYGVILNADATLLALTSSKPDKAEQRLIELKDIARGAMTELRMLIYQLRPATLEEQGLRAALQERLEAVETRSGITVDMQITGEERLSLEIQDELFWIILEGLNNIVKHARARHVGLRLVAYDRCCQLTLKDDGAGFDTTTARRYGGYGLKTIDERLQRIGGRLSLHSELGVGTTLEVEVPL